MNATMPRKIDTIQSSDSAHPAASDTKATPNYDLSRAAAIAQKIADDEMVMTDPTPALSLGGHLNGPFEYEIGHKLARFAGLYVVNGPAEPKHIRYAMEVSIPGFQLRTRCIQRFQGFYTLRHQLLKIMKRCGSQAAKQLPEQEEEHNLLSHLPAVSSRCRACGRARKVVKELHFPRRKLFAVKNEDVEERSFQLEAFLGSCLRLLVEWPGCERGKKFFTVVIGKFLGVNLLMHLLPTHYGPASEYEHGYGDEFDFSFSSRSNLVEVGRMLAGGESEYALSNATGLSSRSESSYLGLQHGGLSSRTMPSRYSSSSSLSLDGNQL